MKTHGGEKLELDESVPRDFKFLLSADEVESKDPVKIEISGEVPLNWNFVHI
jgi:hypothetical protein